MIGSEAGFEPATIGLHVVTPAFVAKSILRSGRREEAHSLDHIRSARASLPRLLQIRLATRVDENSHPASRPGGRGLNPLVADVFPSAFAIPNLSKIKILRSAA